MNALLKKDFFFFSFFTYAVGGTLFLIAQCILIAGWTCLYFKYKKLKSTDFPNQILEEPYRDYDPYLTNIFREHREPGSVFREMSNDSTPESSLDLHSLNQRQLILKHLDHGGSRKP